MLINPVEKLVTYPVLVHKAGTDCTNVHHLFPSFLLRLFLKKIETYEVQRCNLLLFLAEPLVKHDPKWEENVEFKLTAIVFVS
jgi:hypothetical protein